MLDKIKRIVKSWWLFGAVIGAVSLLIAWAISTFKIPTTTITLSTIDVRSQLAGGISPSAGNKALAFLQGYVPSSIGGILAVVISGIALVIVGRIIYEFAPADRWLGMNKPISRLVSVMVFGTLAMGAILAMSLSFPAWTAIVAIAIYAAIISLLLMLADKAGILKAIGGIPE